MKILFYVIFYLLCSALCEKNELFAFEIKDSTLTPSQAVSLNQIRAVGLQTVGAVVVWNQAADPDDMYNDDGRPVWLECDGSSFDTGYYTALASIIPSGVLPSLNDQFLRGGTSAQVGQVATDTIRSHVHGQAAHSHTVSGNASSQNVTVGSQYVSGTASPQSYLDAKAGLNPGGGAHSVVTSVGGDGVSWVNISGLIADAYLAYTSGGAISGATAGGVYSTDGGSISGYTNAVSTPIEATGGSETAPQHIRVRYLIRALP